MAEISRREEGDRGGGGGGDGGCAWRQQQRRRWSRWAVDYPEIVGKLETGVNR